ncbi:CPBP family intramembrane glutamic endopeptidase [Sphingosinicella rhizophila]|uniref:CPBP family intramembrane glutamic endopeptidase n=1 Tax=Sphingosinicella rhizophila TaxID=3050082 RepID=A0ABU3Q5J2_9SPHN|nr:CPBP family intramembrane glutamic endopeptidase [Sphingosinicella sp. GR2756]MDT9598680.1 CPBP family intramembrane glutamic endopeptidase [Sphingosinicella sp. GR2756]
MIWERLTGQLLSLCVVVLMACVAASFIAMFRRKTVQPIWLLWGLLLVILNATILIFGKAIQQSLPLTSFLEWNWLGKFAATAMTLIAMHFFLRLSAREMGMTLRQNPGSLLPATCGLGLMCAIDWTIAALSPGISRLTVESIAFQALMPSLEEELFFRGILFVLLAKAFADSWSFAGTRIGMAVVMNVLIFGGMHAVSFPELHFAFNTQAFLTSGVFAAVACWMRERTGSLLFPFITHSAVNLGYVFLGSA